ncbi:iga1 protease type 2 [Haemophilus influenzae]|uniref:Iga1 protease type 2 n=1 Tax=Haemophilus influenzae TaxID=727 RepID=A0A2X1PZF2_HAEIF|nr:iga1 protease type 2 [Haemophilus influenzae]
MAVLIEVLGNNKLRENNGRYDLYNPEVERRNQIVDTPNITTPNDIQADAPSAPSNNEETASC